MERLIYLLLVFFMAHQGAEAQENLSPIPTLKTVDFSVVEIVPQNPEHWDVSVYVRPERTSKLVGHVARGARIRIRGQIETEDAKGCDDDIYYAIEPFGYICSANAIATDRSPTTEQILEPLEGSPLPYEYAMVHVPEGELVPMWDSLSDIINYLPAKRMLGRGDTIAVEPKTMQVEGKRYRVSIDGDLVSVEKCYKMRRFSNWQGTVIDADTHIPFGWATRPKVPVYDAPKGNKIDRILRRERVDILEEQLLGRKRWLRIGENRFVRANHINEVRLVCRPEGINRHPQWIDMDLGEQVIVAYRDDIPQYATLISSGRSPNRTPRGNYPIWSKAIAITMQSQPYDDKPYHIHRVPWVLFYQAHNALHAAYWHDRFGVKKSHGCANLSPKDAHYLFEWIEPHLPPGWTALHFSDLSQVPTIHVRNSQYRTPFRQERKVGPPDPQDEAERLARAEARREQEKQQKALLEAEVEPASDAAQGPLPENEMETGD